MNPRIRLLSSILPLGLLIGCPPLPPELVTCEEENACGTTGSATTTSGDWTPTTSDGVQTVTGDDPDDSAGSTAPAEETGVEPSSTTAEPVLPPQIVDGVVIPDYIDDNGLLSVEVTAILTEGVTMLLDNGESIELTPVRPGQFAGTISAYTALDNGKRTALLTPWREMLVGESVNADYVIALPPLGYEIGWQSGNLDVNGSVAAIAVLPDGRPVEFGTYEEMGAPRCYLRLRDKQGKPLEQLVPVLASAYCRAIDMKIDRDTGRMHVLVERPSGDDKVWWAGESFAWGKGVKNIGIGAVGDTALALAARTDLVAVCGTRAVETLDKLDALAVLLRPDAPAEARVFDYRPSNDPKLTHQFADTARDCTFSGDTLVLVGETFGRHDVEQKEDKRDRLMVIESAIAAADEPAWAVAGPDQGIQSRALALDLDDEGHYYLGGYTCFGVCEPLGKIWTYAPGGKLVDDTWLGPLGSPHDIAWSPAGYAVVALGEQQGQTSVFKVQAFAPGVALPLWTFIPKDQQGLQLALTVEVGSYGEVYAGGIAADHPAFARIGS